MAADAARVASVMALNDLADQVAAAADLNADDRTAVDFDIEVGDPAIAIFEALMGTRTPLPAPLLQRIQDGINAGWWTQSLRDAALPVLQKQLRS